jgi:hypothetical protein
MVTAIVGHRIFVKHVSSKIRIITMCLHDNHNNNDNTVYRSTSICLFFFVQCPSRIAIDDARDDVLGRQSMNVAIRSVPLAARDPQSTTAWLANAFACKTQTNALTIVNASSISIRVRDLLKQTRTGCISTALPASNRVQVRAVGSQQGLY